MESLKTYTHNIDKAVKISRDPFEKTFLGQSSRNPITIEPAVRAPLENLKGCFSHSGSKLKNAATFLGRYVFSFIGASMRIGAYAGISLFCLFLAFVLPFVALYRGEGIKKALIISGSCLIMMVACLSEMVKYSFSIVPFGVFASYAYNFGITMITNTSCMKALAKKIETALRPSPRPVRLPPSVENHTPLSARATSSLPPSSPPPPCTRTSWTAETATDL